MKAAETLPRWETFQHGSDVGLRGLGHTLAEAFEAVCVALTSVVTDPARVREIESVRIAHTSPDRETLLYDFVSDLVCEMSTRDLVFARCFVEITDDALVATAWGEHVDVSRHEPSVEVKGPTFAELSVSAEHGVWCAQIVVDV